MRRIHSFWPRNKAFPEAPGLSLALITIIILLAGGISAAPASVAAPPAQQTVAPTPTHKWATPTATSTVLPPTLTSTPTPTEVTSPTAAPTSKPSKPPQPTPVPVLLPESGGWEASVWWLTGLSLLLVITGLALWTRSVKPET